VSTSTCSRTIYAKYSPELVKDAKAWAEELLYACEIKGIEHEDFNPFGENLVDNIVSRWVDFEVGLPYPSNGHLT
jgi:hypothetical protein